MKLALLGRNKLGFIDGSVTKGSYQGDMQKRWETCNAIVVSWLMKNVQTGLLSGILYRSDAYLVWKDLKERFDKVNTSRAYHLHKEIATVMQGVSSVSVYYSRLKDLWDEHYSIAPIPSCNCEESKDFIEYMERQKLFQFLMGLNDGYAHARSQILMMNPEPNVNQAYAMIVQDESQKLLVGSNCVVTNKLDLTALYTSKGSGSSLGASSSGQTYQRRNYSSSYCDFCNMKGHTRTNYYKLMKCDFCFQKGHLRENCYKLIGYPENFKGKKKANVVTHPLAGQNAGYTHGRTLESTSTPVFTQEQYNQLCKC
ncbi:uncharacterized protein LOC132060493 [Lycium ferocissimum]|uniref:uncharacterized protein LOC132060493 n=1 Tax=Lycium ferocissimum TaxID=112874 RepID=UPI00281692BB|nr:uncharacterized protein LOC132060493 [Lycium ferocissimum]